MLAVGQEKMSENSEFHLESSEESKKPAERDVKKNVE